MFVCKSSKIRRICLFCSVLQKLQKIPNTSCFWWDTIQVLDLRTNTKRKVLSYTTLYSIFYAKSRTQRTRKNSFQNRTKNSERPLTCSRSTVRPTFNRRPYSTRISVFALSIYAHNKYYQLMFSNIYTEYAHAYTGYAVQTLESEHLPSRDMKLKEQRQRNWVISGDRGLGCLYKKYT